jgi:hypothetical protein
MPDNYVHRAAIIHTQVELTLLLLLPLLLLLLQLLLQQQCVGSHRPAHQALHQAEDYHLPGRWCQLWRHLLGAAGADGVGAWHDHLYTGLLA